MPHPPASSPHNLSAFFDDRSAAQTAVRHLGEAGFAARLLPDNPPAGTGSNTAVSTAGFDRSRDEKGYWSSLRDFFMPEEDRFAFAEGMIRGGSVVGLQIDAAHVDQAMDILEDAGAVDFDTRVAEWRRDGWTGYQGGTTYAASPAARDTSGDRAGGRRVIPEGPQGRTRVRVYRPDPNGG